MELSEAVEVLEVIAARKSGMTTRTQQRDASRVVLDVLAEQGEPEWEYGLTWSPYVTGDGASPVSYTGCESPEGAWETGRQLAGSAQTPQVWRRPMRPAIQAVPAGPWEPVEENGENT